MTERQEIQLRLACAALQGGMSVEDILCGLTEDEENISLWDIMNEIDSELFPSSRELCRRRERELKSQSNTKVVY
jgi:hypothetical protein